MLKNNIKLLRKEQKLTIRDLEEKVHINRATLSRMENGLGIAKQFYNQMETGSRPVSKNVIEKISMLDYFSENDFKKKGEYNELLAFYFS